MAWIAKVPVAEAQGALEPIYDAALQRAGKVFEILQIQSLEPRTLQAGLQLYSATTTDPRSPLPRWFRELLAVRVSRLNHCVY
jgi:alkylhydroperoxidase family enzyme